MFTTNRVNKKRLRVRRSDGETFNYRGSKDELDELEDAFGVIASTGARRLSLVDQLQDAFTGDGADLVCNAPVEDDDDDDDPEETETLSEPELNFDHLLSNSERKRRAKAKAGAGGSDEAPLPDPELTFTRDW